MDHASPSGKTELVCMFVLHLSVCLSVCPFSEALEVSTFLRKNAKKQTARFAGCLELGENLKIPCKMYTKVHKSAALP